MMKPLTQILTILSFFFYACSENNIGVGGNTVYDMDDFVFYDKPFDAVPEVDDMRVYEVNPRVFARENSLNAVTSELDRIVSYGINVLWIMPIYSMSSFETGGQNYGSPYCVRDFYTIDEEFGTIDDLRRLVKEAHGRGMAVIMDFITNHTGWEHGWIVKHKGWYDLIDGEVHYVNKGSSVYKNSVQLNTSHKGLQQEFIKIMKYWIAVANVDGYRCDSASWVPKEFWKEAIDKLHNFQNGRRVIMLAESGMSSGHQQAGFDLNYSWTFTDSLEKLYAGEATPSELLGTDKREWDSIADTDGSKLRHSTNHDRYASASPVQKFGSLEGSLGAFVLASTLGGVPLLYSSQETGYPSKVSFFKGAAPVMDWTSNQEIAGKYKRIMQISSMETLRKGATEVIDNNRVVSYTRSLGTEKILILVNPTADTAYFNISSELCGAVYLDLIENEDFVFSSKSLKPYEYKILLLK